MSAPLKMAANLSTQIGHDAGGCYLEVYTDDDGGSGYGDNPMRGRWYGTRAECLDLDPAVVELYPQVEWPEPYDATYAAGYAYACGYRD